MGQRLRQQGQHDPCEKRETGRDEQRERQRLAHAVVAPGTVVLSDDRPDGAGERVDRAEGDRRDAPDNRPAGNSAVAMLRHRHRHVGVRDRRRDVGQDCGHRHRSQRARIGEGLGDARPGEQRMHAADAVETDCEDG
jgi:hypothetical protein